MVFLTQPRTFCMLFFTKSIQKVLTLFAPVMKLVDMQVLGTCAVRCVGSSPTGGIWELRQDRHKPIDLHALIEAKPTDVGLSQL